MRITAAGIRSGFPVTRFAAPLTNRREAQLGLRRRLGPQMTPVPTRSARVPLVGALRAAARGQSVVGGIQPEQQHARTRRAVILRRSDSVNWSSASADGSVHRPRSRSVAPWRG